MLLARNENKIPKSKDFTRRRKRDSKEKPLRIVCVSATPEETPGQGFACAF